MFIENVLGTKAKIKILRVLSELRSSLTLKEINKETGLSLSITHKSIVELEEDNIVVRIKGERKQGLYKFNTENPLAALIFDFFRIEKTRERKEVIPMKIWGVLEDIVSKIKANCSLIALYGSHARGTATLKSDIDLLIVCENEKKILKLINEIKSKKENVISPMIYNLRTFRNEIVHETKFYKSLRNDMIMLYFNKKKISEEIKDFINEIEFRFKL